MLLGTKGPLFCNSAIHFNPDELTPILNDLKEYWTNVEANTKPNSFWEHEWKKHGTCASILPQFDSVTNYFTKGLKLNKNYDLVTILESNGVVPNTNGYTLQDVYNTIKNSTGKEPSIQCVTDKNTKESFMSEIRLCFNKTLDLIGKIFFNNDLNNKIYYFKNVYTSTFYSAINLHCTSN